MHFLPYSVTSYAWSFGIWISCRPPLDLFVVCLDYVTLTGLMVPGSYPHCRWEKRGTSVVIKKTFMGALTSVQTLLFRLLHVPPSSTWYVLSGCACFCKPLLSLLSHSHWDIQRSLTFVLPYIHLLWVGNSLYWTSWILDCNLFWKINNNWIIQNKDFTSLVQGRPC